MTNDARELRPFLNIALRERLLKAQSGEPEHSFAPAINPKSAKLALARELRHLDLASSATSWSLQRAASLPCQPPADFLAVLIHKGRLARVSCFPRYQSNAAITASQ